MTQKVIRIEEPACASKSDCRRDSQSGRQNGQNGVSSAHDRDTLRPYFPFLERPNLDFAILLINVRSMTMIGRIR
jgi:hypothetical protein